MDKKFNWIPRGNVVILKGILKDDVRNSKIIKKTSDNEYFIDDFRYFVHDVGPDVRNDLEIGSEIYCNYANIKLIHGTTDRKSEESYYMIIDQLIDLFRVPETIIK